MSDTSDNSSYADYSSQKNFSYSSNGNYRCDDCQTFVHSLGEHMKSKHNSKLNNQSESEQTDENSVFKLKNGFQKIDSFVRNPFRYLPSSKNNSPYGTEAVHVRHNGLIEKENCYKSDIRNGSIDKTSDINSVVHSEVKETKVKHSRKKLEAPSDASLSDAAITIKKLPHEARPSHRFADLLSPKKTLSEISVPKKATDDVMPTKKTFVRKTSNYRSSSQMRPSDMPALVKPPRREMSVEPNRPKIPSVFEMFNIRRSNTEMRDTKVENDNGYEKSSSQPTPGKRLLPKHSVQCPLCSNVMPKTNFKAHFLRTHYDGNGTLDVSNDVHAKCEICGNLMPQEHISTHIERSHGNPKKAIKNKDNFVDCKFCSAHMHIDYMPGHLFRKHKSHEGTIGIIWSQYSDEQVYEWFSHGLINIKNGGLFVVSEECEQ